MNALGLDTCFPALSVAVGVALGTPDARIVSRLEPMATGHAERLLPLITELLAEAALGISDIDRIALTIGPGSFTGTRIGIAAVRAFKIVRDSPVVAFTSLEAIALSPQILAAPGEELAVAIDAHRGEAYVQIFDGATRASVMEPRIVAMTDAASVMRPGPLLIVGTAAEALAASMNAVGGIARACPGMIFPDMSAALARAGARHPATSPVEPLYLRPPDAKPQEGKDLERTGA